MINIIGLIKMPPEQQKFVADYLDTLRAFRFHIETYRGYKDDLPIQNTDLWIESYIDIVPELQEFRDLLRSEMERLEIKRHVEIVYERKFNHFYYENKGTIEKLRNSVINEG